MTRRLSFIVVVLLIAVPMAASAQVPRLSDGKPDMTGVFTPRGPGGQIEREALAKLESLYTPAAVKEMGDLAEPDDPLLRCVPYGVPRSTASSPWPFQIIQHPGYVVVLTEYYHSFRIIPYGDGLTHSPDIIPTYFGDSVARWDGDTLVVDVRGFNDRTVVAGYRHTEELRVVERYTRTSHDTIAYEASITDPNVFAEAVRYSGTLTLHPEWEIGEYVCAENNQDYDELFEDD